MGSRSLPLYCSQFNFISFDNGGFKKLKFLTLLSQFTQKSCSDVSDHGYLLNFEEKIENTRHISFPITGATATA